MVNTQVKQEGEDEAGQGEEEFDPEITARRHQVDQPHAGIMMAFAIMIENDQDGRNGARAGEGGDGGGFGAHVA